MSWFRKSPRDPNEVARVKDEVQRLRDMIDNQYERVRTYADSSVEPAVSGLTGRVDEIDAALRHRMDAIDAMLASRNDADLAARIDAVIERLELLDTRITSVSTELANQVSELGTEIDTLSKRAPDEPVSEELLDDLRDSQERLANEQARYQIAFRADLARLADQIKRPRP